MCIHFSGVRPLRLFRALGLGIAGVLLTVSVPLMRAQLPTGAQVVAGQVGITQANGAMTLLQSTNQAIVNWQSFNIGAGQSLNLVQPGADAAMLARVLGGSPSQLQGTLSANGSLFLINPRGVVIGRDAIIDTASFLASTLDVADQDFLRGGAMTFKGDSGAGIVNLGKISAREGNVALISHTIKNHGEITAPNGTAALAAGTEVFLAAPQSPNLVIRTNLTSTAEKTGVENTGVIKAAQAQLEAAGGSIYELAINQSGVVRATGVERRNGRVLLTAGGGTVGVAGEVSARKADGTGGEILVGGDYAGANAAVANATRTIVTATASLDASAAADSARGDGGRVVVWADQHTHFLGSLSIAAAAQAGNGGFAEVSGKQTLNFAGSANLSAPFGLKGNLLLDPSRINIVAGTTDPVPGGLADLNWAAAEDAGTQSIGADTLAGLLATGNVTLDTSNSISGIFFTSPLAWNSANSLTVKSGGDIDIDSNITAPNATVTLRVGKSTEGLAGEGGQGGGFGPPESYRVTLDTAATLTANKVVYGVNTDANPAGQTVLPDDEIGSAFFDGNLVVPTVELDLDNIKIGLGVFGANNTIGAIRTTGTGELTFFYAENHNGALNLRLTSADATAPAVTAITPGTLTLEAGSSLSFTNQTNVVLVSRDAGFINQAGSAPSPFGTNSRFLVYAASVGLTNKGGLTGEVPDIFSRAYSSDDTTDDGSGNVGDFASDTLDRFVFEGPAGLPFLTYTADNKSRAYGSANPTLTATVTGLQGGDVLGNVVSGAPTFATTATQNSGVGGYDITVGRGTLASATYDFQFFPGTLTISRAPLTITANSFTRTPNTANPALTVGYSGFVLGENQSVVSGLQVTTDAVLASPVGSYAITPSAATAANYSITFVPGALTVTNTAPLSITANNASKTYGADNPSFTAVISGLVGTDTSAVVTGLQFNTAATMTSGVGTYTVTPFGATAPGYVLSYFPGTLTINPAPLTIVAQPASRVYGEANPTFTATYTGLVAGDSSAVVSGVTLGTTANEFSSVLGGPYPITVSGGTAANYAITRVNSSLTVTKAPVLVKADDKTRVYGDPDPVFTYTTTGLKNGDRFSDVVFIPPPGVPQGFATPTSGIGAYGIFLQGFGVSENYNVSVQSGSLTITQRPLTISADNLTKVYGDPFPTLTASFTGLASFDSPSVIPGVSLRIPDGIRDGVQTLGIFVTSGLNQNYKISYQFGQLQITPAPLNVTGLGLPTVSRLYGRPNPEVAMPDFVGLRNGDTTAMLGAQLKLPAPTTGVGFHDYSISITNPNYTLNSFGSTGTLQVEPAPINVQLGGGGRLYGDANPASYGTRVQGIVTAFGDSEASVLKVINPADPSFPPGTYKLVPEIVSPNYTLGAVTEGNFVIRQRSLTVDITSIARYYGDPTPDFTWKIGGDGLAPADNITAVMSGVKTSVPVSFDTNVGLYRIDPTPTGNPNYVVSWWPAYLAILQRPVEITVNNGISFGNDNLPANFAEVGKGLNLITFHDGKPGGDGYTATVTGLPSFVTQQDYFKTTFFETRSKNEPVSLGTAQVLADYPFPTRPVAPPPPAELPPATGTIITPAETTPASAPVVSTPSFVILSDFSLAPVGNIFIGEEAPKDTTKDRFPDVIRFIVPRGYGNSNYVVTKITNGVLTMKADPLVVEHVREVEAAAAKKKADSDSFYQRGGASKPNEIVIAPPVAFGLPRDAIQSIREAVAFAINQEIINGEAGGDNALARAINGGEPVDNWSQLPNDKIMAWLADLHTNPAKQALLAPSMMAYTMNIASKDPGQRTETDTKLLNHIMPSLTGARQTFLTNARDARNEWLANEGTARGQTLSALFDGKVPYDKIMNNAVSETMGQALQKFDAKVDSDAAARKGAQVGTAVGAGAASGVGSAAVLGSTTAFKAIFPFAKIALERAGSSLGAAAGSAAAGPAAIIGIAVTILITEATAVADNEQARVNFENMLNSGSSPINPTELMKSDQGKAIMMLALAKTFLGV